MLHFDIIGNTHIQCRPIHCISTVGIAIQPVIHESMIIYCTHWLKSLKSPSIHSCIPSLNQCIHPFRALLPIHPSILACIIHAFIHSSICRNTVHAFVAVLVIKHVGFMIFFSYSSRIHRVLITLIIHHHWRCIQDAWWHTERRKSHECQNESSNEIIIDWMKVHLLVWRWNICVVWLLK
jgi:hypothetical protein